MANPHNVELEAAKFLHKLIQDSKDEPTKLATKLYVILQHMRSSGKENSMPYQVISRAMETVIKQHGLDIEALMSSRHPLAPPGAQLGESASTQVVGSSQRTAVSKDPKANLAGNEVSKSESYPSGMSHVGPSSGGHDSSNMTGAAGKVHGMTSGAASSYPPGETGVSVPMQFASPSYDNHGFAGKMHKESMEPFPAPTPSMDPYASKNIAGRTLDQEGGGNLLPNANKLNQAGIPSNAPETSLSRNVAPRDTGKAPFAQAPVSGLPFKEHHLKQLRAQCLVFLAFRNGLMPKKLHLEIALGNFFPKEGPRREMNDHKGKEQSIHEPHNLPEVSRLTAGLDNTRGVDKLPSGTSSGGIYSEVNFSQGADNTPSMKEDRSGHHAVPSEHSDERRLNLALRRKPETEMPKQERSESQASSMKGMQCDSAMRSIPVSSRDDDSGNNQQQPVMPHLTSFVPGTSKHMKPEVSNWPGNGHQLEASKVPAPASGLMQESQQRKEICASQSQSPDGNGLGHRHTDGNLPSLRLREPWKPIPGVDGHNVLIMPMKDSDVLVRNVFPVHEPVINDEDPSAATDCLPSPKYTTLEKWIFDRQKRKLLTEKTWAMKHQKTEQKKIAICSAKLKESVTSSEDINAKTKSVIELKKLKLLDLQRHLRGDILSDFFKPIASEMDRLKSIKKHRIGRRSKQLERYEQKMKEERQKRIRERQKEFFSEVEVHREKLEDVFKMKRERWKGFNKYIREFHKRKERIHREKIDRIQREKINLLKINDVEGYLRMVQDAKSDRVKQLLKETEKYLQKLGSKLQAAKNVAGRFESDVDDSRTNTMVEKNEISFENEDETDQAKHYLESNEKYYMMAHSVKEIVLEQPTMLLGGKLREYQMNGLRWLVSLYNNHLNGILADEMGLGKTVQVISLLCYLMETKNDRGPFLVVVPSSVLPGWESEINFWAPGVQKIVYSGPPEERRRLFKEQIIHQKFNVLLTTYEYLMNKHDRPKLSKVHWHYVIIDEGHRIKNASCKLNADLKHYRSNHRLLLTGTPLQNNLEELWALLNFLLPNIFNSSEDFSQWFNKPFESNGDNSADEALLSEEENLLIINRLHQVLRPFVLRRLKHKVENQLPEKIEKLIRCEASSYQKLLIKRVEENLGAIGTSKARSVHNSVMELRNICNHPYLSQLHVEEVHELIPKHYLPNFIRICGKLEMLDRLLPKLKATDHRVLLFSTMTRLLDVMEDYLCWKQYKYLRLDGHTSGGDRGALIDMFNQPGSPFFIFLLSIRAGGVGVNLQAADTVIIFDTDWNPQVDLQAQARAHRIGQKKEVLVLRLETVQTVEEQVRASAEHKLGVANQSITAGFFDNNTSAEDRREYLESLLRECKKEEVTPVLNDDALNYEIARSESEIDVFESVDKRRREEEMEAWMKLVKENGSGNSECLPPLPSRLLMEDDLKVFYEAMKITEVPQQVVASNVGMKRKSDYLGGLDTRRYGRGKRAREVRSYEEQLTEEEFEKLCQVDSPESPQVKEEITEKKLSVVMGDTITLTGETQRAQLQQLPPNPIPPNPIPPNPMPPNPMPADPMPPNPMPADPMPPNLMPANPMPPNPIVEPVLVQMKEVTPPSKRGRGRPRRTPTTTELSPSPGVSQLSSGAEQTSALPAVVENVSHSQVVPVPDMLPSSTPGNSISGTVQQIGIGTLPGSQPASLPPVAPAFQPTTVPGPSMPVRGRGRGRKAQSGGEAPRRRGKRQSTVVPVPPIPTVISSLDFEAKGEAPLNALGVCDSDTISQPSDVLGTTEKPDSISGVTLLPASTSVKSDFGSQEIQVLNQSMLPGPDAFSGSLGSQEVPVPLQSMPPASDMLSSSLVTSSVSNFSITPAPASLPGSSIMAGVTQDPTVMSSPCSNPVLSPAFPSIVSISPSTAPADSAPKQGRGRGRKVQSGVEAPRRRGKRQNPEAPAAFEASTDQDPKFFEVPEKNSRVNVGRRPTRRNKQEHDVLKQAHVLHSVTSPSITNPAITQVSDSRLEDEAGKSTNTILLDGSTNLVGPVVQSVLEDKLENEAQEPTNGVHTGASQSIEASQGNKINEENEAQQRSNSIQSNPSQDNCLPVGQIFDDRPGNEAPSRMNDADCDVSKVLSNSDTLEESKAERDDETKNFKELEQLDPSVVMKESSSTSIAENWLEEEAQKQVNLVQSDPSPMIADTGTTLASEVEQEDVVSKPTSCVESDASQSISDPSRGKMEGELEQQISKDNMAEPHCVPDPSIVAVNKDLLHDYVDADAPRNKSDPSVSAFQDVFQEIEAQKETNIQLDTNAEVSESVPRVEHAYNSSQVVNDVIESGKPSNNVDTSIGEGRDVNEEIEARRETDVHSNLSVVISGPVTVSEHACDKGGDTDPLYDVMELDAPKITADPLVGEIRDVDQEIEALKETDAQSHMTVVISESVPAVENESNGGSGDHALKNVINSNTYNTGDSLAGEAWNVDQENEARNENVVISESVPAVENDTNGGSGDHALNIVINSNTHNTGDPLAGEAWNVDQENESQKETDVQSDRIAMMSERDAIVECADGKCKTEFIGEVGNGLGEFGNSSADINATSSTSVAPVSDILHGEIEDHVRNEELANKEPFPGAACDSTPPTEDNCIGDSNVALVDFNSVSVEQDIMEVESKETAVSTFLASKPQLCAGFFEENSRSVLAIVQSAAEGSSCSVPEPENHSGEEHVERNRILDGALVSDPGLTENSNINEECGDDSVLPVSSKSGISSPNEQSYEGEALAAMSSFVPVVSRVETGLSENLTGEDRSKEFEQKGYFDGSKTSELLNEGPAAPDYEPLEERSDGHCDEMAAEEHENNENVPSQDSVSVLCVDENVVSFPEHVPCKLEDLHEKGATDDSESKATGLDEVPVLKQSTATVSPQEIPPLTLGTMEQVVLQSNTMIKTENKASEEQADRQENIGPSVESLVQKLEVTEVSSGKADAEVKSENDLVLAHASADSQSLEEITSLTCSALTTEAVLAVSPNEEFQIGEDESTSKVKQSFVPAPDNCETVTNSTYAVSDVVVELQQDAEKTSASLQILNVNVSHVGANEESMFQHGDDIVAELENRNADVVSNAEATCERVKVLEVATISNAETSETRSSAISGNSGKELDNDGSNVSNAEATAETLKVLEETTVLNAEINETRASSKDGKSENQVDMQIVEENIPMDLSGEVSVSSVQTISSKDAMPDMAEFSCGPGGDDLEKLESRDQIVEKESLARVDVSSVQSSDEMMLSSDLVLETVQVANAGVIEERNAHNATEISDNNTNCAGNLLETMDDSGSIGGQSSLSLQVAGLDVTHTEVLVEKSEIMHKDFVGEVQGSKEVESVKTVASDPEVHEAQVIVTAGTSQPKNGLQQLVEQYSDAAADVEVSFADSLTVALRDSQSSVDDSLKASQLSDTSAFPASVEVVCSCPAENVEEDMQQTIADG